MTEIFMKRILYLFVIGALVACSSKPTQVNETHSESGQLLKHVMSSAFDSTVTLFDVREELYQLIDTMYTHAAYHPNIDVRIGAKSLAMDLTQMFLLEEYFSPNEILFFEDSVLLKLTAINQVWYIDTPTAESDYYPVMNQAILRHRDDDDKSYITEIDVCVCPDSNFVMIFFPEDAIGGAGIMFSKGNDISKLDEISFHAEDAFRVYERTDSTNYALMFGQEMIDAMMSHEAMFIGYVNDNIAGTFDERFKDCMTLLGKFHEQYPELLKLQ